MSEPAGRAAAGKGTMEPAAPCPSLEDLAAFQDGGLPVARRREVVEHLATCPACYEVVMLAAVSLDGPAADGEPVGAPPTLLREALEELRMALPAGGAGAADGDPDAGEGVRTGDVRPFDARRPRPARLRWRLVAAAVVPLAALVAVVLGLVVLRGGGTPAGLSSRQLAAQLGRPGGAEAVWGRRPRGGEGSEEGDELPPDVESFQLGVRQLDFRQALAGGDPDAVDTAAPRLARLLKVMYLVAPETVQAYRDLADQARAAKDLAPPARADAIRTLLERADRLETTGFADVVEPTMVAFGRWTEACRLSGKACRGQLFRSRTTRELLAWLLKPQQEEGGARTAPAARLGAAEVPQVLSALRGRIAVLPATSKEKPHALDDTFADLGAQCQEILQDVDPN